MKSEATKHFVTLDFYRFVAAFGIVLLHFTEFAHYDITSGFGGDLVDFAKFVDFFFILSGFVIGLTSFDQVDTFTQIVTFLRRRIARIYPMHVLTMAVFLAPVLLGLSSNRDKLNPSLIFKELLLVRYWQPHAQLTLNFPSWSISVEWAMYLLFPFFVLLSRKFGWKAIVIVSLVSFGAMQYVLRTDPDYHGLWFLMNSPLRALPTFTIGVALSRIYDRSPIRNGVWLGVAVFSIAIVAMVWRANTYIELFLFALSIWLTAAGYASGDKTLFDRHRIFRVLGNASYSLYMLHVIFLIVFVQGAWPRLSTHNPPIAFGLAVALATTLTAIISYHLFEKPMRNWLSGRGTLLAAPQVSASLGTSDNPSFSQRTE